MSEGIHKYKVGDILIAKAPEFSPTVIEITYEGIQSYNFRTTTDKSDRRWSTVSVIDENYRLATDTEILLYT